MSVDIEWANTEDTEIPTDLPQPLYWRVMVMPIKPVEKTKSGIYLPSDAMKAQEYNGCSGKIVAMGGCATKSDRFEGETNLPKVGDYVLYGKYAGQKITYKGVKFSLLNDDEILAVVSDPGSLKVFI